MKRTFLSTIIGLFFTIQIFGQSQGVSITLDGSNAHESAMLDVKNPNKGILIPRVALLNLTSNVQPVNNPAEGLLVYNEDNTVVPKGFYYWTGSVWNQFTTQGKLELSFNGNTLSVTGGNSVDLSPYLDSKWTQSENNISHNVGNVGIGTTDPKRLLDVNGEARIYEPNDYWNPQAGFHTPYGSFASNGSFRVTIEANGYRGVNGWVSRKTQGSDAAAVLALNTQNGDLEYHASTNFPTGSPSIPDIIFKVNAANGNVTCYGSFEGGGADFAEYMENEEKLNVGDIVGLNAETGKVRKYQNGDMFAGIVSETPAIVGNNKNGNANNPNYSLVGISGQLKIDETQVTIENRIVKTKDGVVIGMVLSNGKVFVR